MDNGLLEDKFPLQTGVCPLPGGVNRSEIKDTSLNHSESNYCLPYLALPTIPTFIYLQQTQLENGRWKNTGHSKLTAGGTAGHSSTSHTACLWQLSRLTLV